MNREESEKEQTESTKQDGRKKSIYIQNHNKCKWPELASETTDIR